MVAKRKTWNTYIKKLKLEVRQQVPCTGIHLVSIQSQRWADRAYLVLAVGGA